MTEKLRMLRDYCEALGFKNVCLTSEPKETKVLRSEEMKNFQQIIKDERLIITEHEVVIKMSFETQINTGEDNGNT